MTKLHIENVHVHIDGSKPSISPILLAALAGVGSKRTGSSFRFWPEDFKTKTNRPAIGDKWPGTEAVYAGKSISRDGSRIIDLIFWPDSSEKKRTYADNIKYCESVSPETGSHAATRLQAIVINDNLRHLVSKDHWHWTETKDNDGDADFVQSFDSGGQFNNNLNGEYRALAVSEYEENEEDEWSREWQDVASVFRAAIAKATGGAA